MHWMAHGVGEEDRLDAVQAKRVLRRTARGLRPYRALTAAAIVCITGWTATVLAGPFFVRYGIDHGIKKGDAGVLNRAVIAYVVTAAASYGLYRGQIMLIGRVGEGFLRDLRNKVFDHLLRLSMPFYDREKAGVIVSRMTSDVDSLAELVQMGLLMFVSNAILLGVSAVVLAAVSWQLLLVSAVMLPFVIVASVKFKRDSNRAYLTVRDRIGSTLSRLQEGLSGVRVIQAYVREDVEVDRFARSNRQLFDAHMDSVRIAAWYLPVIEFAGLTATAAAVGVGGWMVGQEIVTIGTVTFFVLTLSNLFEPVQQLSQLFNMVQSAGAGLHKLYELLDTGQDVPEAPDAVELPRRGEVLVEGASFTYAGSSEPALREVDLTIDAGERFALVGPTGAGKSTLAKLISRLYDPADGRVTFAGIDLRGVSNRSLRQRIVVVPQEGFLFNASILDNVRVGRDGASDAEVRDAMAAVGVLARFSALPEGLDTVVRERGARLSAGEKQLLSLARAALAGPGVLVLDEATSSLDPGTEALVDEALNKLMAGRTVVVIAHRLSTAERADRVGVVDGGRLVEVGTHRELLARNGRYTALHATWIGSLVG